MTSEPALVLAVAPPPVPPSPLARLLSRLRLWRHQETLPPLEDEERRLLRDLDGMRRVFSARLERWPHGDAALASAVRLYASRRLAVARPLDREAFTALLTRALPRRPEGARAWMQVLGLASADWPVVLGVLQAEVQRRGAGVEALRDNLENSIRLDQAVERIAPYWELILGLLHPGQSTPVLTRDQWLLGTGDLDRTPSDAARWGLLHDLRALRRRTQPLRLRPVRPSANPHLEHALAILDTYTAFLVERPEFAGRVLGARPFLFPPPAARAEACHAAEREATSITRDIVSQLGEAIAARARELDVDGVFRCSADLAYAVRVATECAVGEVHQFIQNVVLAAEGSGALHDALVGGAEPGPGDPDGFAAGTELSQAFAELRRALRAEAAGGDGRVAEAAPAVGEARTAHRDAAIRVWQTVRRRRVLGRVGFALVQALRERRSVDEMSMVRFIAGFEASPRRGELPGPPIDPRIRAFARVASPRADGASASPPWAERLIEALDEAGVDFLLGGELAARLHGLSAEVARLTVVYDRTPENLERIARALAPFAPMIREAPATVVIPWNADFLAAGAAFPLRTRLGEVDLLATLPGGFDFGRLRDDAQLFEVAGRTQLAIGRPALVASLRAAGGYRELSMAAGLYGLAVGALNPALPDAPQR